MKEKLGFMSMGAALFALGIVFGLNLADSNIIGSLINNNSEYELTIEENSTIYFNNNQLDLINYIYKSMQFEVVFCLYGDINGSNIIVKNISQTKTLNSSENNAAYLDCIQNEKFLGNIHTHPSGTAKLSNQDIYTWGKTENYINGIIYGENQLLVFTKNNLYEPIEWEVNT